MKAYTRRIFDVGVMLDQYEANILRQIIVDLCAGYNALADQINIDNDEDTVFAEQLYLTDDAKEVFDELTTYLLIHLPESFPNMLSDEPETILHSFDKNTI